MRSYSLKAGVSVRNSSLRESSTESLLNPSKATAVTASTTSADIHGNMRGKNPIRSRPRLKYMLLAGVLAGSVMAVPLGDAPNSVLHAFTLWLRRA